MIRLALIAGTALTLAAALPAMAQTGATPLVLPEGTLLDINAEGSSTRVPDLAVVQAGVVTQAATAGEAMQQNSARMAAVLAALRKAGIAERDIQTSSISLNPQYRYADNQPPILTGYQASNQVTVRFRDIARTGTVIDALVKEGANNLSGPTLMVDKPEAALDEARIAAIAKARARADLYAKAAGLRVDRILSISEGGPVMPVPMPMQMMARGRVEASDTQVAAGERELSVSVAVRFLLK